MTRETALAILELSPEATAEQIEQRYSMLILRLRRQTDSESVAQLAAVNEAYEFLIAADRPSQPVDPRSQRLVFGKTQAYWANRWHYDRWTVLGIAVGAVLLSYLVFTVVTNRPPDFKIVAAGNFYMQQTVEFSDVQDRFESSVIAGLQPEHPEIKTAEIEWINLAFNADGTFAATEDAQSQQAMEMKFFARFGAENLDVVIFDQGSFANYSSQVSFVDLTPLVAQLSEKMPPDQFAKIKVLHNKPAEDKKAPETVSGLDVSELDLLTPMGLTGDSVIVTIGPRCKQPELAVQWLADWISSSTMS